jgi:antitoxin VapB
MTALNIKNEEAVRLVRELAELEGESMTTVVIEAVREKLDRTRNPESSEARVRYWIGVGDELRASMDAKWLATDPTDDLYDERGLPK